jgi:hypothetical protein
LACSLLGAVTMPAQVASGQASRAPSEILAIAARNGDKAASALKEYAYYVDLTIEIVGSNDVITGRYHRFSQIYHDPDGSERERVFENKATLPEDAVINTYAVKALMRVYQFTITQETLGQYEFNYVGRERIDEIGAYAFDVRPLVKLPDPEKSRDRYLKGRVWIDDRDLQVVKVAGEAVPEQNAHRTPRFETYFQNQDNYWFPAYTSADDQLRMARRMTRVMVKVRFTGYKKQNDPRH